MESALPLAFLLVLVGTVILLLLFLPGKSGAGTHTWKTNKNRAATREAASLVGVSGPLSGRQISIDTKQFTIGRSSDNRLVIEGELVSRYHAVIVYQEGQYILYDRESTNGTWVNGARIAQHVLQPGDQILIGPWTFAFQRDGLDTSDVQPQPPQVVPVPILSPQAVAQKAYGLSDYELIPLPGGEGGTARVYKGISRKDGSVIAVKVLYKADPYLRAKFEQEGRKIGLLLHHPHITEVYDYGEMEDGIFYIVMEYVPNGSLRQRIQPHVGIPLPNAIRIVGETCDALQYAHKQGIIHRDIKPENILFGTRDEVKLADFGIAKLAGERTLTESGLIIGTPYYMSYEQAKGLPVDPRSDIYSLGIVLYEMLTGCVPFTGDPLTVVHRHITEPPTPPTQLNPSIPPAVEQVVMRALEKDINKRFSSAEQMARALGYRAPMSLPAARPSIPAYMPSKRPPAMPVRLVVLQTGRIIPLHEELVNLHRRDVNPNDDMISRTHARIVRRGESLWLEDLGSTNGTYLNEQRLFEPALLKSGDVIRVGATQLRVEG